jgi:hypothetical protein
MYHYEYTTAQNQNDHGTSKNLLMDNKGIHNSAVIPVNPALPPIRRINNHLPPKNLRMSSIPRTEMGHTKPAVVEENSKLQSKYLDGESVMNFSGSGSDSESEDGSYTDDDSEEQTTYSYAEDETPATSFNCMNSLFLPSSNDHEMNDAAIIRCHRVGPSSAELQLNIPLPAQWTNMHHLPPIQEGQQSGYMDNVCKAPSLNYNHSQYDPALFEEAVVEIDPFKQYRERIAPQFYESLIEEDSDEDADSDDDEIENDSVRQRDDSQIFGHLDAQRSAIQEAMYNDIVLRDGFVSSSAIQSPPSQVFVTESTCSGISPELVTSEQGSQEVINSIESSNDGSSEVFSRPEDGQDSSLTKHLREAVEFGFAAPSKVYEAPKQAMLVPSLLVPATRVFLERASLAAFPSFDEPGRITSRPHAESKLPVILEHGVENKRAPLSNDPIEGASENCILPTKQVKDGSEDSPDDEIFGISSPAVRFGRGLRILKQSQANEEDGPADENIGLLSPLPESPSPSHSSTSTPCDFDDTENASVCTERATTMRPTKEDIMKQGDAAPKVRTTNTILDEELKASISTDCENDTMERKVDVPLKRIHRRFVNRPILEETSKSNARTEMYEASTKSERQEKSSRELRMDRIRSFDPVRPALAAATLVAMFDSVSNDASRRSQPQTFDECVQVHHDQVVDVPDLDSLKTSPPDEADDAHHVEIDEVPDFDDLMEFHSCDEDFFTSHTRSEQFSSAFLSNLY